jgi:RNA polymerase sigma-70 factor (ECF subfamily)
MTPPIVRPVCALLAEDAILVTDGGGKRKAAHRVMVGRADIVRLLEGLAWRGGGLGQAQGRQPARINGYPGLILRLGDGPETIAFQPRRGRQARGYLHGPQSREADPRRLEFGTGLRAV